VFAHKIKFRILGGLFEDCLAENVSELMQMKWLGKSEVKKG